MLAPFRVVAEAFCTCGWLLRAADNAPLYYCENSMCALRGDVFCLSFKFTPVAEVTDASREEDVSLLPALATRRIA